MSCAELDADIVDDDTDRPDWLKGGAASGACDMSSLPGPEPLDRGLDMIVGCCWWFDATAYSSSCWWWFDVTTYSLNCWMVADDEYGDRGARPAAAAWFR